MEALARADAVELEIATDVGNDVLVDVYRESMATVCASELEPFGLTVLESVACGTPVVAVKRGGYRETVAEGVNGLLVEPRPEAIGEGIARIQAGAISFDAGSLHQWILDEKWSWQHAADRLDESLVSLAQDDRRP